MSDADGFIVPEQFRKRIMEMIEGKIIGLNDTLHLTVHKGAKVTIQNKETGKWVDTILRENLYMVLKEKG